MVLNTAKTINSLFMVPTLGIEIALLKKHGYISSYSIDSLREVQYPDAVYILFKPKDLEAFKLFLDNEYIQSTKIIEDYNYEGGYVIVVYALLPEFKADYALIKQGKYSLTSKKFQALFSPNVYIIENGIPVKHQSIQYKIFNRTKDLIAYWEDKIGQKLYPEQELWIMYEEENESLKL